MLVQGREVLFAPQDPCQDRLLRFVRETGSTLLVADYSYNLHALTEELIALHQQGMAVHLVLDASQAAGSSERPEIAQLKAAGLDLVIGTSEDHRIMHNKFLVRDGLDVLHGSYNFTSTAAKESNVLMVERFPDLAGAFTAAWHRMRDWIVANEPQG